MPPPPEFGFQQVQEEAIWRLWSARKKLLVAGDMAAPPQEPHPRSRLFGPLASGITTDPK